MHSLIMQENPRLAIQPLNSTAFSDYGWMLGKPFPEDGDVPRYRNDATDFWQEHVFDTGPGGEHEVLWVNYRSASPLVNSLEKHLITQQAIIPLTGELIQVVAASGSDGGPDLSSIAAFSIIPGQGICMRPGCWHATRVRHGGVCGVMLTRRSTTADLIGHLQHGDPMQESAISAVTDIVLAI